MFIICFPQMSSDVQFHVISVIDKVVKHQICRW